MCTRLCALPLEHVVETMRPLPTKPVAGAPHFVRGLAIIRGVPTPVVDAARLFSTEESQPLRFVTVRAGDRRVAVAFDSVLGVRPIPAGSLHELPLLLRDARAELISAIGALDGELLLVLRSARLVPEDVWNGLEAGASTS
ncbi:MAG: chemotaxis protein CheW [Acidobacteria bacterium]|nr:chemotaxis protein CheW [Acidobacteriota bacterium]